MKRVRNRFSELLALKERRESRNYSRRDIADITGISLTSIQNWANNKATRYDELQILAFCEFFKCEPGDLFVIEITEEGQIKTPLAAIA